MATSLPKISGPKTPKGKRTSSRNSMKHGLTAAQPITLEEDKRLAYLIKRLRQEYKPKTITEDLLIDRLANIQLCLERINKQERAWYDLARREAQDMDKILDTLDESHEAKRAFAFYLNRLDSEDYQDRLASLPFLVHRELFTEIAEKLEVERPPTSYDEFVLDYPELNKRIGTYCEAFESPPKVFLMDFKESADRTAKCLADLPALDGILTEEDQETFEHEMSEALKEDDLHFRSLIRMTFEKLQEKLQVESIQKRIIEQMETMPAVAGPSKEKMDQLMRYRTSLNNQFSKALGELRHVIQERKREQLL